MGGPVPFGAALLVLLAIAAHAEPTPPSEDIVVVAPSGPDPSASAASVTVMPIDERVPASADVASMIDAAAGATVRHLGGLGDWAAVSIRGSSLRQVHVCIDGIPLNPDGATAVNLAELPLRAFSRIEVFRNNAPPELGVAPIGGVVNLVTGDEPVRGVLASYGSFRTARVQAMAAAHVERSGWFVAGEAFATEGDFRYFDDNGTIFAGLDDHVRVRENNEKVQVAAHLRGRGETGPIEWTVLDSMLVRDEGLPGSANQRTLYADLATRRNLGAVQVAGGSDWRWRGRLWHQVRDQTLDDRHGEIGIDSQWQRQIASSVGVLGDVRTATAHGHVGTAVVELRRDTLRSVELGEDADSPLRQRWSATASLGGNLRWVDERLVLTPVVQVTARDDAGLGEVPFAGLPTSSAGEVRSIAPSPRLGVLVRPWAPLSLKANVGYVHRAPDLIELFGEEGAIHGNPDLVPEHGWSWDGGVRFVIPDNRAVAGSVDAVHFWSDTRDLIVYVQNAQQTLLAVNLGHAWVQGLELAIDLDWLSVVHTSTSLTHTVSRNLSTDPTYSNNQLPRVPAVDLQHSTSIGWRRVSVGHTFSYTSGNYWDATNWFLSPPRALHGAFVRAKLGSGPELELDVLNATDRIALVMPRNPLDPADGSRVVAAMTDFAGFPLPGRTILFTIRWEM